MKKPPFFWTSKTRPAHLLSMALLPFALLYQEICALREDYAKPYKSTVPVICIGGYVLGGSGKTPVLKSVLELIVRNQLYHAPIILMRGYGGSLTGPTLVDPGIHSAKDVGDEALLHAQYAHVIIARNRADGAQMAEIMGADIILMDDGLQNLQLIRDKSFLVVDSKQIAQSNGMLFPAGPLRESFTSARGKCLAVIETSNETAILDALKTKMIVTSSHDKTQSYIGFAGIGRPEKFKNTLKDENFHLAGFKSFPDHHPYTDHDMDGLLSLAEGHRLITTEKDWVRIPHGYQSLVDVLTIDLEWEQPEKIIALLKS